MTEYVRFQSAVPNRRGRFPGVFALANGLASEGALSPADATWLREANDRANAAYADPTTVVPECYDANIHPGAAAWFRSSATDLLELTSSYLALLDRYDIPWVQLRTARPGRIVYADDVQVVAVPLAYPDDWPFATTRGRSRSA